MPASAFADGFVWSGTLTISRSTSGDVLHNGGIDDGDFSTNYTMTGTIEQSSALSSAVYRPRVTAYSDIVDQTGDCDSDNHLVGADAANDPLAAWIEWGRPAGDGSYYVPRFIPNGTATLEFPAEGYACLAYDGGALQEYPRSGYTPIDLPTTLSCNDYGPAPGNIPIGASSPLPPPMPARRDLGDGRIAFTGTVATPCSYTSVGATSDVLTMTYDLIGTPDGYVSAMEDLHVVTHGTQYGAVIGAEGAISCGLAITACDTTLPRGSSARLGVQLGDAGMLHFWLGCDQALGYTCLLVMNSARSVHGYFGYDFVGQWEPPPTGLFSVDRKAEIAGNGASAASDGAVGCGLSAGVIGAGIAGGGFVAVGAVGASRSTAFLEKVLEETVGSCAQGLAGTMYNGLLLKIDPPDPAWRQIALAERFPAPSLARCTLPRGCAKVTRARAQLASADRRIMELQEALAVASNRYGNAANAKDKPIQAMHQATMRATSGLLAQATLHRNRSAAILVAELRRAGIRKIVISRAAVARAVAARRAGKGIPKTVVTRLLRKKLIVRASEVPATMRSTAPRRIAAYDALRALGRPTPTRQMQTAADALTMGDVARLVDAVIRDTRLTSTAADQIAAQLELALRCDPASPDALRQLAVIASRPQGADAIEGRLLIAIAAREVATHALARDEACRGGA